MRGRTGNGYPAPSTPKFREDVRPRGRRTSSGEAPLAAQRTWLSAAGMPDSSSHSARKLCSSKSASTWREKVTSERSLRTQYTVSSMARARPSSARPGLGTGLRWRRGLAGAAGRRRRLLARPLAPSLLHTRSVTHSLPPSPGKHSRRHPPAIPPASTPAAKRTSRPAPRPAATRLP